MSGIKLTTDIEIISHKSNKLKQMIMKKYFLTMATVALFAIGFAASDDDESSNNENSNSTAQTEQQVAQMEPKEEKQEEKEQEKLFAPGNSYISNKFEMPFALGLRQFELTMYNDGTYDMKETIYLDGEVKVLESDNKWEKKTESRKDIVRTWYKLKKSSLLVDEDGKIYVVSGSNSEHEAVGKECLGTFRKK